jgi:hypothetical protein
LQLASIFFSGGVGVGDGVDGGDDVDDVKDGATNSFVSQQVTAIKYF